MRKRWSLKEQNRGASLIAVMVALVFVGVIGMIIAQITITNIQLKEAERASKANFYSAEEVMDDLTSGLNNRASVALQEAYNKALASYRDAIVSGEDIQTEFTRVYLKALQTIFDDSTVSQSVRKDATGTNDIYVVGGYKRSLLAESFSCYDADYGINMGMSATAVDDLKTKMSGYLDTEPANPAYHLDYPSGTFTLKDVGIRYTNPNTGYETHITTDVVFHTPEINFTGSNVIKEFMRYSLIADTQVLLNAKNITINGNVYAGHGGILADLNSQALFKSNTIVTRGDVTAKNSSDLKIGEGKTKLWAENIKTIGDGSPASLELFGNFYISDDLTIEGDATDNPITPEVESTKVKIIGNYYGYNFQETYITKIDKNPDAAYSSAIMINGKNSTLDMTNINYLLLSGRTYISRGNYEASGNQDVMLGESLSVRTNQLAYYVPPAFLDTSNPSNVKFIPGDGIRTYAQYLGMDGMIAEIEGWLDPAKPIVAYHYPDSTNVKDCYYLNFANEQSANNFFTAYVEENRNDVESYATTYVAETGLVINDDVILTLKGDILYRQPAEPGTAQDLSIYNKHVEITGSDWAKDGIYWDYANRLGMTYKSLQMYLEESHENITAEDIRFENDNDKTLEPLMSNLMDVNLFKTNINDGHTDAIVNANSNVTNPNEVVILVDNAGVAGGISAPYSVPTGYTGGIIIATGDVQVNGNFNGMIIAGGTISFATNASVTADEILVSKMFSKDMAGLYAGGSPLFAFYFKDYDTFSESVIGMIEIERFTTYSDWTKTEE